MLLKKEALADIFALITFGIVVGMAVELMAGLSVEQSMRSRLFSIPMNFLIARPYGLYRDWVLSRVKGEKGNSFLIKSLLDAIAYTSFQIPVYASLVTMTGAAVPQILQACIGQIAAMLLMGGPYGMYLQWCRNWIVPSFFSQMFSAKKNAMQIASLEYDE